MHVGVRMRVRTAQAAHVPTMIDLMDERLLHRLATRLDSSSRVTVLTGAGISAASGVPTFRGTDGLWKERGLIDLATPEAFAKDPGTVWDWYAWRRAQVAQCEPNAAHHVLARWTREREGCRVITQNVDDLHLRAGTERLLRLHGSLWNLSCSSGCAGGSTPWRDEDAASSAMRRCPYCGAAARPAVVWFGEALGTAIVAEAIEATSCDVFILVGTSSVVYPAAGLVHEAEHRGAFTVEINTETTSATDVVNLVIPGAAEEVLPALDELLLAHRSRKPGP